MTACLGHFIAEHHRYNMSVGPVRLLSTNFRLYATADFSNLVFNGRPNAHDGPKDQWWLLEIRHIACHVPSRLLDGERLIAP